MNLVLTMVFLALMSFQTVWAGQQTALSNTVLSGYVDTSAVWDPGTGLNVPASDRLHALFPSQSSIDGFSLQGINDVEGDLDDNLHHFSSPAFQIPGNLSSPIHDYLTHAPQDTQQMINKLDGFKIHPEYLYKGYDFPSYTSDRSWNIFPQELPQPSAFTPQEQTWVKQGLPFGRLGITQMTVQNQKTLQDIPQWNFELSVFNNNKWEFHPGYRLGESLGLNGPLVVFGKTPQGPDVAFYTPNGDFVGDVTKPKWTLDPAAISKYMLKANFPGAFGPSMPYDRTVSAGNFLAQRIAMFPLRGIEPDWKSSIVVMNEIQYNEEYWDEAEDCDDPDYYDDHEDECEEFYDEADPPYAIDYILWRHTQDKNPNDPLYPNPKPKKKSYSLFGSILMSVVPLGNGGPGVAVDSSGNGKVNVIDQYYLPQIGYTDLSDHHSAWNAVDTKGPNVTVAVIDSGMDLAHPDGPEFVWSNPADGSHGRNFIDENTGLRDEHDHGTLIAGIIAAKTNNGIGMAGINAGAVIMPLKVADKNGIASSLNIYRAIHYAVDHGARVINISLGSPGVSELENLAINYARSHNVLVVIASGNDGSDIETFGPSSSGSAIAVSAVNYDGSLATVSNWGANNSLAAPGEQIYSLHSKDAPWDGPAMDRDHLYTKESGTSFSAPMVAATASLLLVKNPNLTADQLEDILLSSAKPLGQDRWEGGSGAGLLDAAGALRTDPQNTFNVRITRIRVSYKQKRLDHVDVYATVRGAVDYFTVEIGRGKHAHSFKPVIGFSAQQANNDLVAHIPDNKLRGSNEWVLLVRATDKSGKQYLAQTGLTIK